MAPRAQAWRALFASFALASLLAPAGTAWSADAVADAGEAIFRRGVLGSGAPLEANRDSGARLQGAAAACVSCHRRSGLGAREGRSVIPPVTGRYLFRPPVKEGGGHDVPFVDGVRADREAYSDASLARAIREGIDSEGKPLNYLMPNYALNGSDMAALIAYLKRLDQRRVPGVTDAALHFATIITPDADPAKRRGMLEVLEHFFADRNARQFGPTPTLRSSGRTAFSKMMFRDHRRWELHVWQLSGPESTWREQLERYMAHEPVFAVVSGLGGANWAPVHAFCEREAVPCLFPNIDVPIDSERDFYSLYLSKGVLLEAELIASRMLEANGDDRIKAVRQIYRAGDSGEAGAKALAAALKRHGIAVSSVVLARGAPGEGVAEAMRPAVAADALVLWLRPADVAALGSAPDASTRVYMSGLMGGLERSPLPSSWRSRTRLAYPFDLPERRRVRVDFALGWFSIRRIPVVAEQVQADTYLACGLLAETLNHMADAFVRDYLIERVEDMLAHRLLTGYYPRLTLGTGQRFASKGGYVVQFADPEGRRLAADGDWLVP